MAEATALAEGENISLDELIAVGLRAQLSRLAAAETRDFFFPTAGGQGLRSGVDLRELTILANDVREE